MALFDEVVARYGSRRLAPLTSPEGRGPPDAVDEARLSMACSAVVAAFETYVGLEYDATDEAHVDVACDAVVARLQTWGSAPASAGGTAWTNAVERMRDLAAATSRGRVLASSSSPYVPSEADEGDRPRLDDETFETSRFRPPVSTTDDE